MYISFNRVSAIAIYTIYFMTKNGGIQIPDRIIPQGVNGKNNLELLSYEV